MKQASQPAEHAPVSIELLRQRLALIRELERILNEHSAALDALNGQAGVSHCGSARSKSMPKMA
jgi:hypothetical protein